jgi:hypothetical protein
MEAARHAVLQLHMLLLAAHLACSLRPLDSRGVALARRRYACGRRAPAGHRAGCAFTMIRLALKAVELHGRALRTMYALCDEQ